MDFNSILIGSEDPERLVEYYTRLFGEPTCLDGGYTGWQLGSGFVTIGPHDQVKGKNAHPGRIIWNIESNDVKGDFERFKAAGRDRHRRAVRLRWHRGRRDASIATFADPDDNYFQLMSPMEMSP